ncbi:serine hydrolase domain-containing protein [Larkinella sp. VNQ87]|uniref:serine hydrolase domain-containing protein n=1 Tax=Larkinella sp. VNQ87 TaxID=3400921 RepID=UPI003BFF6BC5
MLRVLALFAAVLGFALSATAQINQVAHALVRDSIIARFNRNDFKGIYQLADTAFTKSISESRLVNYLKANRNSGNIIRLVSQEQTRGGIAYRLAFEVRDMNLFLKITPQGTFSSFGLSTVPIELLPTAPPVKSTNPLRTAFDRSIDSLARDYFRNPTAVGVSIGLIKDGKPYSYYYGETTRGSGLLPGPVTEYEIASITKTFTATLLAQAVVSGKVSLKDDIRRYLPGDYPNLLFADRPITLQDLANHTARLPSLPPTIGEQPDANPLNPEPSMDSLAFYQALRAVRLDTLPGYKFEYSNWGMALLGHILETVYRQPYGQLVQQSICAPLGMRHTHYQHAHEDRSRMAQPYSENGNRVLFQDGGLFGPAGDIHSTLPDMIRYLQGQIEERDSAIRLSHQPTVNNTGLGWGTRTNGAYRDIQHNGSSLGFRSHLSAFPERRSGCVLLANSKADMSKLILGLQTLLSRKNP